MPENVTDPMELLQEKAADAIEVLAALMHDETVSPNVRSSSALGLLEAALRLRARGRRGAPEASTEPHSARHPLPRERGRSRETGWQGRTPESPEPEHGEGD